MRRFAMRTATLGSLLVLSGCGYSTWWGGGANNPHLPVDPSENMTRVMGALPAEKPLLPEPGDIWPGKIAAEPTLEDMEADQGNGAPPPFSGQPAPPGQPSTPLGFVQPKLPPLPKMVSPSGPAATAGSAESTPGGSTAPATGAGTGSVSGKTYQTPQGPMVTTGGAGGYQTATTPGGGQAIIVPNGNGTSTIIHADGTLETVPTPK